MVRHTSNAEEFTFVIIDITQYVTIQVTLMLLIDSWQTAICAPNDVID